MGNSNLPNHEGFLTTLLGLEASMRDLWKTIETPENPGSLPENINTFQIKKALTFRRNIPLARGCGRRSLRHWVLRGRMVHGQAQRLGIESLLDPVGNQRDPASMGFQEG